MEEASERRDRFRSGEVEAVRVSDPNVLVERIIGRYLSPPVGAAIACDPA